MGEFIGRMKASCVDFGSCFDWFMDLIWWQKFLLAMSLFVSIFIILRIFHYFTKDIG